RKRPGMSFGNALSFWKLTTVPLIFNMTGHSSVSRRVGAEIDPGLPAGRPTPRHISVDNEDEVDKEMKLLPPPSVVTRRDLIELMQVVRSYVHLVLPRWSNENGKEIATAVMLRAGNRLFAVTANHCVRQEMSLHFRL